MLATLYMFMQVHHCTNKTKYSNDIVMDCLQWIENQYSDSLLLRSKLNVGNKESQPVISHKICNIYHLHLIKDISKYKVVYFIKVFVCCLGLSLLINAHL